MREPFFQGSARDQGGSLKRLNRPNRFRVGYLGLKGRVGINLMPDFDPGYPQRGPYEASEGIYPGGGQGKTGGGQALE